ncbi:ankyrin repeat domain-containing protein SOWAHB [Pseudophryne corroboree]|uniref:ankyrin repeat domain-containing protein SOWAHB n=1 Tax=Pseudophryne corroboree TaxID=495146 RepID=UPI00308207D7
MAKELSQEEVLDFLCQGGGKVPNTSLVGHFKHFLRDTRTPGEQLLKSRERFKRYVNSVAVVKQEGAVKYVVLRSRYRDLLGEDLRARTPEAFDQQEESELGDSRQDDQIVPGTVQGLQVGGGWSSRAGGRQVPRSVYPHQDVYVRQDTLQHPLHNIAAISQAPYGTGSNRGTLDGKIWDAPPSSYREPFAYDRAPKVQQASSRYTPSSLHPSLPPNGTSTSPCQISPPSSTSSPEHSTSLLVTNTSVLLNQTPSSNGLSQVQTSHTYTTSSKTISPPSNSSSAVIRTYNSHMNKLSSPCHNRSSFSSSAESPATTGTPSPASSGHRRHTPGHGHERQSEEIISETTNVAVVPATSMTAEGQTHGYFTGTEFPLTSYPLNYTFAQDMHDEYSNCMQGEQQIHNYHELPASPPSSRYIQSKHPSPSLLFPQESSIPPPDVLLMPDYHPASRSPSPPLPINDMHGMWMYQMPVFKSIRSQLSLQDMEDFVDQESCGSEGSDSGEGGDCDTEHRDEEDPSSDSHNEKFAQYIEKKCDGTRRCPPNRKFLSIVEQYDKLHSADKVGETDTLMECGIKPNVNIETRNSPYTAKSFLTDQAPILFELAVNAPKHRISSRLQEIMSSSDDELIDRDYRKRRRPSRTKRPLNIVLVPPQPDVDILLAAKPVNSNHSIVNNFAAQKSLNTQYVPKVNLASVIKSSFNYKISTVPLDPTEHDWIVKSACGSWLQVYGLFIEDPHLALRKDFMSGYTALHWFAKHGAIDMFFKFVNGAKKAGIELDLNLKSNGGYTPLHIAAIHGHHKVAAMLVEKMKVNVKLRDNSGKRAWQYLSCNTSGEVWQLLGAPKGKTIFASRALKTTYNLNVQNVSSQLTRKTSLAAFLKPQHQKWKAHNHSVLREREIYSD